MKGYIMASNIGGRILNSLATFIIGNKASKLEKEISKDPEVKRAISKFKKSKDELSSAIDKMAQNFDISDDDRAEWMKF